jgi:nucleoside-diphosphate-sugar epimerase
MTRVLLTGAHGFVGRFTARALAEAGLEVVTAERALSRSSSENCVELSADSSASQMHDALRGIDAVVHLAALVHDMTQRTLPRDYERVNRDYPVSLARAAAHAGVRRFVFVSTIKVNGDSTEGRQSFSEASAIAPSGPYAESKWQAECGLTAVCRERSLSVRIVRPPLVYGPFVRANFLGLMRIVKRGLPLPFGAVRNARSLVYVENLADLLLQLVKQTVATPDVRTYLVSDGEDLSTPGLIRNLALALGVRPRLLPVPEVLLTGSLALLRRRELGARLLGSLRVDSGLVRRDLAWQPPFSVAAGLGRTARWFNEVA